MRERAEATEPRLSVLWPLTPAENKLRLLTQRRASPGQLRIHFVKCLEAIRRVPNGFSVRASLLLDVRTSEVTRVEGRARMDFD